MTEKTAVQRPPAGLGTRGRSLFTRLVKRYEFDDRELEILTMAARQADAVEVAERAVKREGYMIRGSTGQLIVNPAVAEARLGRLAVDRMLGRLALPDADAKPQTASSRRAQKAANVRWDLDDRRARRGAA